MLANLLLAGSLLSSTLAATPAGPPRLERWGTTGMIEPENVLWFHRAVSRALAGPWSRTIPDEKAQRASDDRDAIVQAIADSWRWDQLTHVELQQVVNAHNDAVTELGLPSAHKLRCEAFRAVGTRRRLVYCVSEGQARNALGGEYSRPTIER